MRLSRHLLKILGCVSVLTLAAFAQNLNSITTIASTIASTVPANGDINPYGIAVVPVTTGALKTGSILISNFNNSANLQGTGTTIVQIGPDGNLTTFAKLDAATLPGPCPGGIGLTTALVALHSGFVIVGSLPTTDGTAATAKPGCLIALDSHGRPVATLSGNGINGPWDMTAVDFGPSAVLFVSNVLNGTVAGNGQIVNHGTILRIVLSLPQIGAPKELSHTVIASGFQERTDPNALVIGPTGLGFANDGRLFVADTLQNRVQAIPNALSRLTDAGMGETVFHDGALNGPLGLCIGATGNILTVNAGDGNLVEITPAGTQVAVIPIDVSNQGAGTLFGLAIAPDKHSVYYVDDGNNTLNVIH